MSQYLSYNLISNQIKFEMSGQAPAESKILLAVNAELRNLNTKYDIDSFSRTATVSIKTDGTRYNIDDIITTLDCRKVLSVSFSDESVYNEPIDKVNEGCFSNDLVEGKALNQFTTFTENGNKYIRVSTTDLFETEVSMKIKYITSKLAIDPNGNFYDEITSGGSLYALIEDKYLDLIVLGCKKRLFYPSIGDTDQNEVAITRNRYESELGKLGLSDDAKMIQRKKQKITLRRQW